jgi:hypothetical protein
MPVIRMLAAVKAGAGCIGVKGAPVAPGRD